jgi:hypothetical protein
MMKYQYLLIGMAFALGSVPLAAQTTQLSLGADVGIPVGDMADDGASLILGPTLGLEIPVGTRLGITLQTGYHLVFVNDDYDDRYSGWNMIPAQLGLKYYFTEQQLGFYGQFQAGIHAMIREFGEVRYDVIGGVNEADTASVTFPTLGINSTLFSWALGVGYQTERLDVSLRYNAIGADDRDRVSVQVPGFDPSVIEYRDYSSPAYSYIGIRIAYLFNLGSR